MRSEQRVNREQPAELGGSPAGGTQTPQTKGPPSPNADGNNADGNDADGNSADGNSARPRPAVSLFGHKVITSNAVSAIQVVCLLGYAAATAIPGAAPVRSALFIAVIIATAVACLLAAAVERQRPVAATAWFLLSLAHLGIALAGFWAETTGDQGSGVPVALAGMSFLIYYPPALIASALLVRDRTPRWLPSMWWDGAVVALGAGAVTATVLWSLRPAGGLASGSSPLGFASPVADAVMLTAILSVTSLSGTGLGAGPWRVALGLGVVAVADAVQLLIENAPDSSPAIGLIWLAGYALVGLDARAVNPDHGGERRRDWGTDRRRTAADAGPLRQPARGSVLPLAISVLALAVVTAAVLGAPVPRGAALLGLADLTLVLGRSATAWAGRRMIADPNTDALTGLASRQALSRALSRDGIGNGTEPTLSTETDQLCLLLVNIDRFKDINAALGHAAGDRVLAEVGARLHSVLREGQLLARLGGDEFAVLLLGTDEQTAQRVAGLLRESLTDPIGSVQIGSGESRLHVQASVGIAACQLRRGRPEDLLRQADVAMTRAKSTGTGIAIFEPKRDRIDTTRLRRTDELRSALEHGDLEVHLQPQVNLATGAVVGAEALARWRHPQDGVLLPASFLPLAARTGLLRPVAALVLDKAVAACARWWSLGHTTPVSINLTADELRNPDLPDLLEAALTRYELPSSAICIEITEDALLADPPATAALLQRWRAAGVGVALDDFGTGYSSLAYLRDLPLDELKIDRAFVSDLRNRTTATIVRYTVAMAHALRLRVVGEGVEDAGTARLLADTGCDIGQGLYFGDAMHVNGFISHLDTHRA